jgi:hypothetical protein
VVEGGSGRKGACAAELRRLLEGPYRHVWLRLADRARGDRINFSAVAKVLARAAEFDRPEGVHHRELRDRVRRALGHDRLTNETLELFLRGFSIRRADADRLWRLMLDMPAIPEPRHPASSGSSTTGHRRSP